MNDVNPIPIAFRVIAGLALLVLLVPVAIVMLAGFNSGEYLIPSGAKADSGGDSQRAESLNLWRQVLGGHGHGYSDRIAGGF